MDDRKAIRANRSDFPLLISAIDLQAVGIPRPTAYQLLNRSDMPVVMLGRRKFLNRDLFFKWLDEQSTQGKQTAVG
ncbi:MAG: DNA-binding protein [Clostridia bacterium]|nr:DNA-binding protein [Clostridia bacterium]